MNIYLVRHGDATYLYPDDLSPLSSKGEKEVDALARFLSPLKLHVSVFHSGKLRAQQTAERLATGLILNGAITARTGLNPMDSVLPVADELKNSTRNIMLVGHMPFMGRLAGQLIHKNADQDVAAFHKGTMMCLEHLGNGNWGIEWVIHPGLLLCG